MYYIKVAKDCLLHMLINHMPAVIIHASLLITRTGVQKRVNKTIGQLDINHPLYK